MHDVMGHTQDGPDGVPGRGIIRRTVRAMAGGLCVLSVLACIGTAWLWRHARTGGRDQAFSARLGERLISAGSDDDAVWVSFCHGLPAWPEDHRWFYPEYPPPVPYMHVADTGMDVTWGKWGVYVGVNWFSYYTTADHSRPLGIAEYLSASEGGPAGSAGPSLPTSKVTSRNVRAHHAWVVAATVVPPLLWCGLRGRRLVVRRRRRRLGRCLRCGYDLRAGPRHGGALLTRCPECGQETTATRAGPRERVPARVA